MRSLPHSLHEGRGVQTHARQSWQRWIMSLFSAAASQKGFASVVIAGNGFLFTSSLRPYLLLKLIA